MVFSSAANRMMLGFVFSVVENVLYASFQK